jgi:hypothetical protein
MQQIASPNPIDRTTMAMAAPMPFSNRNPTA